MVTVTPCTAKDFPTQDNLFQSAFWGTFKSSSSHQALYFFASYNELQFPLMILIRTSQHTNGYTYAYAPKAPSMSIAEEERGTLLEELSIALQPFLPADTVCIRYDVPWTSVQTIPSSIRPELRELQMNFGTKTSRLKKAPMDHLCPDTVLINLTYSPEQLLMRMRQTTRNSIRKAYRSNVVFRAYTALESLSSGQLKQWYGIYKNTALRKKFYYEEYDYFERLFLLSMHHPYNEQQIKTELNSPVPIDAPAPLPHFHLFTASKDDIMLSGMILAICSHTAYYMYAGSTLEGRDLMPNYGLQWEAQLFARKNGCTRYDLMGIPPTDNSANPMYGLFLFKTGYGGDTTHFLGSWDYVYAQNDYQPFTTQEVFSTQLSV